MRWSRALRHLLIAGLLGLGPEPVVAATSLQTPERMVREMRIDEGIAAYREGDFRRATRLLNPSARLGDPGARYFIGALLWRSGYESAARRVMCDLARGGDPAAGNACGVAWRDGFGGPASGEEALRWFEVAAAGGDGTAALNLARVLLAIGTSSARARAVTLIEGALPEPEAAYLRAALADQGIGPRLPAAEVIRFYETAAAAGHAEAANVLGNRHDQGDGVAVDPVRAAAFYARAAAGNSASGAFNYAGALLSGRGVAADRAAALSWLLVAGRLGPRPMQAQVVDLVAVLEPTMTRAERRRAFEMTQGWRINRPTPRLPIPD